MKAFSTSEIAETIGCKQSQVRWAIKNLKPEPVGKRRKAFLFPKDTVGDIEDFVMSRCTGQRGVKGLNPSSRTMSQYKFVSLDPLPDEYRREHGEWAFALEDEWGIPRYKVELIALFLVEANMAFDDGDEAKMKELKIKFNRELEELKGKWNATV